MPGLSSFPFIVCSVTRTPGAGIRQSNIIRPINVKNTSHHISLYADDILLFVDKPASSILHILALFDHFSFLSGYKINWSKSCFLPLNFDCSSLSLPDAAPVVSSFHYLGIDIYPSLRDTVDKNFNKILSSISADLLNWTRLPNSLYARISVVKMNVLPRVNFYSAMLPLPPPTHFWA